MERFRCIFMGTPEISVPFLERLNKIENVVLVVTKEDKPQGRGHEVEPPPVKVCAQKLGIEVWQPSSLKSDEAVNFLKKFEPDIILVVAYGKILPSSILEIPKVAPLNIHFSLLPKYRGAAPVQWAIVNGETETGVTIIRMNEKMDAGDILLSEKVPIAPDDTTPTLFQKLIPVGIDLMEKAMEILKRGEAKFVKQNDEEATYAPIIKKEDGLIDWKMSAEAIYNRIRGFQPWPCAYTYLRGKLIKILKAEVIEEKDEGTIPGLISVSKEGVYVQCGKGKLLIKRLQMEGKREMDAEEMVRGRLIKEGEVFESGG